jgi:hypothetical protein
MIVENVSEEPAASIVSAEEEATMKNSGRDRERGKEVGLQVNRWKTVTLKNRSQIFRRKGARRKCFEATIHNHENGFRYLRFARNEADV